LSEKSKSKCGDEGDEGASSFTGLRLEKLEKKEVEMFSPKRCWLMRSKFEVSSAVVIFKEW